MTAQLLSARAMARGLRVTPRRVQQLAAELAIGQKVSGVWVFSLDDVREAAFRTKPGRPRKEQRDG